MLKNDSKDNFAIQQQIMMLPNREKRAEFFQCISGLSADTESVDGASSSRLLKFSRKHHTFDKTVKVYVVQLKMLLLFLQSQKYHVERLLDDELFSEIWSLLRGIAIIGDTTNSELTNYLQITMREIAKLNSEHLFLKIRSFLKKQNSLLLVEGLFQVDVKVISVATPLLETLY